jgi:phosphoglycolate/pyridoxal phosphate phosphatase family enzyme
MIQLKDKQQVQEFVNNIDVFLFDCDGVLWHGNQILPNIRETLQYLRSLNKKLYFITNNNTKSREGNAKKFQSLGIDVHIDEILTSSFAAATYLSQYCHKEYPDFTLENKKVFVVGREGITEELANFGIQSFGASQFDHKTFNEEEFAKEWINKDKSEIDSVCAVVVGYDNVFNNYKLAMAASYLRANKSCRLIATNTDDGLPFTNGLLFPGSGSFVSAIATGSGRFTPDAICGKPNRLLLDYVCDKFNITDRQKVCMIGDRLDTDIRMGNQGNVNTLAVLSGVVKLEELERIEDNEDKPHLIMDHLSLIYEYLVQQQ